MCESRIATDEKGFRDGDVSGALFFCRIAAPGWGLRKTELRQYAHFESRVDLGQFRDEILRELIVEFIVDDESDPIFS